MAHDDPRFAGGEKISQDLRIVKQEEGVKP